MNGLNFILNLYDMQYIKLAEILGINKQNITLWVKGKQNIPKKYLSTLEEIFNIDKDYFIKDLTHVEKLEIQKEKLKKDLKPIVSKQEEYFIKDEINNRVQNSIYNKEEIEMIEIELEKAKLVERFKNSIDNLDDSTELDTYKLILELVENTSDNLIVEKTISKIIKRVNINKQLK